MPALNRISLRWPFTPGEHGGTFGGNPLMTAVGYEVVKYIIEKDIPGHAARVGNYMRQKLAGLQSTCGCVLGVRGNGLLLALELNSDISADVVSDCLHQGLLVNNVKPNAIRFMPPLIITERDVDEMTAILEGVLKRRK